MRPRLLLVEDDVARRLEITAALASSFDVMPVAAGEDPLRVARARRPDLALVVLSRRNPDAGLRLCRALHADVRPVARVGVIDPSRSPRPEAQVMELWGADGYLGGGADVAEWVQFAERLARGERPVRCEATDRGLLARLIRRFRRGAIVPG